MIEHEEIFGFGKLYYDNTSQQIYNTGKPLFDEKETMNYFDDYEPYVVGKEGLLKAIEIYRNKIIRAYKDHLVDGETLIVPLFRFEINNEDIKSVDKLVQEVEAKIKYWEHADKYIFSENENKVTNSTLYEYSIFNLIYLLKTMNFETETILFYGC